jgi:hypothetical protein
MVLPANPHPVNKDIEVAPEIEAGSMAMYQSSINATYPGSWEWLTPHIRNRWRLRFQHALNAYLTALNGEKNGV